LPDCSPGRHFLVRAGHLPALPSQFLQGWSDPSLQIPPQVRARPAIVAAEINE
jgi:hypothetical protein